MEKTLREKLIKELIDRDVETNSGDGDWYLRDMLYEGCGGYNNMSDEDIVEMAESVNLDPKTGEWLSDEDGLVPEPPGTN